MVDFHLSVREMQEVLCPQMKRPHYYIWQGVTELITVKEGKGETRNVSMLLDLIQSN